MSKEIKYWEAIKALEDGKQIQFCSNTYTMDWYDFIPGRDGYIKIDDAMCYKWRIKKTVETKRYVRDIIRIIRSKWKR